MSTAARAARRPPGRRHGLPSRGAAGRARAGLPAHPRCTPMARSWEGSASGRPVHRRRPPGRRHGLPSRGAGGRARAGGARRRPSRGALRPGAIGIPSTARALASAVALLPRHNKRLPGVAGPVSHTLCIASRPGRRQAGTRCAGGRAGRRRRRLPGRRRCCKLGGALSGSSAPSHDSSCPLSVAPAENPLFRCCQSLWVLAGLAQGAR